MRRQIQLFVITILLSSCITKKQTDYVEIGNQYARDGLLREAGDSYRKALSTSPNDSTARRNLGIIQVKSGDYKNAVRNLERSMTVYEDNHDANFYLAEAYRAQDKYAEAIFRYQRAHKLKPNDPKTLKALSWSYFKIRYYSEALSTARLLQKASPDDGQATIILARTLLKAGDAKQALSTIRSSRGNIPKHAAPYYASVEGDILFAMNRYAEAANAYQTALKEQPLLPGALLGMGRYFMHNKNTDKAITYMERAIRIRPRLTEALYLLGKAYENKNQQKSLRYYAHFRKQAAKDPEFVSQLNEVRQRISSLKAGATTSGEASTSDGSSSLQ